MYIGFLVILYLLLKNAKKQMIFRFVSNSKLLYKTLLNEPTTITEIVYSISSKLRYKYCKTNLKVGQGITYYRLYAYFYLLFIKQFKK